MKKRQVSPHTQKAKVYETMAKILIRVSAGITMGILVLIIGFIVYKGLISDIDVAYDVVGKGSTVVPLDEQGLTRVAFIVHRDIRIKDISIGMIRSFFNGDERYWLVSEQGLKVRPFVLSPQTVLGEKVKDSLLMDHEEYARSVVFANNDAGVIDLVAHTRGGIGIIDAASLDSPLPGEIKPIPVRFFSIVVNKDVQALENNKRLSSLSEETVIDIFTSMVRTWSEVDGRTLPVTLVSFNEDSYLGMEFSRQVLNRKPPGTAAVICDTFNDVNTALHEHEGAVGYGLYLSLYKELSDRILPVERREIKPNITFHFLFEKPAKAGKAGGISTIIVNTILMIILTLLVAGPIGVGAAIYLTEYATRGKFISVVRFFTETLAGIPSIIFGLFGYIVFVNILHWGMGLLSGTLTITIMILPTIIRTSEEAFKTVPGEYREESLALGATPWQTIKKVVTPAALPGILTGIILSIGRAVGETAAVLFTLGSSPAMAKDLFSSARVLSLHLYILAKEGISFERAFATAFILVVIILVVNTLTTVLIGGIKGNLPGK